MITAEKALEAWRIGNNAGNGYDAGLELDTPAEAAESEGWDIVLTDPTGLVVAERCDGSLVAIGDANGPWAVDLGEA